MIAVIGVSAEGVDAGGHGGLRPGAPRRGVSSAGSAQLAESRVAELVRAAADVTGFPAMPGRVLEAERLTVADPPY